MSKELEVGRQITVRGMTYAPTSEQGVVFLFGRLAPALGFCIERVQIRFPDCLATRRGKKYRIEFEYWASDFRSGRRFSFWKACSRVGFLHRTRSDKIPRLPSNAQREEIPD